MAFDAAQPAFVSLRNIISERTERVLAWVGAGISMPAGLPSWAGLRASLAEELERKASTLSPAEAKLPQLKAATALAETNLWNAFSLLKDALGDASYSAAVRDSMAPAISAPVPVIYRKLWHLGLGGILNLNIDKLSTRAYNAVHRGAPLAEFAGKHAAEYVHVLTASYPFIANLHGTADQSSSWVFTANELRALQRNEGYKVFLQSCLTSRTVLFIGIGADDIAVGGYLAHLRELGVDLTPHYWITNRTDAATDKWAEAAGVRVIRYQALGSDHPELEEALDLLANYVSEDPEPLPVAPSPPLASSTTPLPPPEQLQALDSETIRGVLNTYAAKLLEGSDPNRRYEEFYKKYRGPIYRAWDVTTQPPENVLLGYRLTDRLNGGAFGDVYRAVSPQGETVAVKVLRGEVRSNPAMLQSFRRGVHSMRILSDNKVSGMVPYRAASEIPACAFMDFVDGPNLVEAVQAGYIRDWQTVLKIALDLTTVLKSAHMLPERVLHRDVKPANVMLKGYYENPENWELVVLDFDLSWHRDASGMSVDTTNSMSGYLAPEQLDGTSKQWTRNALVDSFGTGMTLFFLRSGREPMFAQQRHSDWPQQLADHVAVKRCAEWLSLPRRFARLIENATRHRQVDRWDMTQIHGELTRLTEALTSGAQVVSAELLAEEIAARSDLGALYRWESDSLRAAAKLPTGVGMLVTANESQREISVDIEWVDQGLHDRKNIGRWIPAAIDQAAAALRKAGWSPRINSKTSASAHLSATMFVHMARHNIASAAAGVSSALAALSFDR